MQSLLHWTLQPLVVIAVLALWLTAPGAAWVFPLAALGTQVLLSVLEYIWPARRDWRMPIGAKANQVLLWFLLVAGLGLVGELYAAFAAAPLEALRAAAGLDVWPHHWPLLVQLAMVFLASEFIWYWVHRAEHRWAVLWRVSGHGAHHSFGSLNALNAGLNHPFEFLFLVAPAATLELLFGIGPAALGAATLLAVQTAFAHTNLDLNCRVIGWVFTTNRHHIHHHSRVLAESNSNFGCAAILWDRVFGTFADAPTAQTGTGPTEPTLLGKALMPFREPGDTAVAPR